MKPVQTPYTNVQFRGEPFNMWGHACPVTLRLPDGQLAQSMCVATTWQPSEIERDAIANGACVELISLVKEPSQQPPIIVQISDELGNTLLSADLSEYPHEEQLALLPEWVGRMLDEAELPEEPQKET